MGVLRDWECMAHPGPFESRSEHPKCKHGCSPSLVKIVYLKPPGHVSARTRTSDRLVRQSADGLGLSDISTSPSRPGGSVAERNRAKLRGPQGRQYPDIAAAKPVELAKYIGALTHKSNELERVGLGRPYRPAEWKKDPETGKVKHTAGPSALSPDTMIPKNSVGVSIDRVKE